MSMSLGIGLGLTFSNGGVVRPPLGFGFLILNGKTLTLGLNDRLMMEHADA